MTAVNLSHRLIYPTHFLCQHPARNILTYSTQNRVTVYFGDDIIRPGVGHLFGPFAGRIGFDRTGQIGSKHSNKSASTLTEFLFAEFKSVVLRCSIFDFLLPV